MKHLPLALLLGCAAAAVTVGASARAADPAREHYFEGIELDRGGHHEEAIKEFAQAIRLAPTNPLPWHGRGLARVHLGAYDAAIADLNEAIRLDPRYAIAYNTRGGALQAKREYEEALKDFRRAVALAPGEDLFRFNVASIYTEQKRYGEALEILDAMIRIGTRNAAVYFIRGNVYGASGKYPLAIADYDVAIRLAPDHAAAYRNRGLAHQKLAEVGKACEDWRKACELEPVRACPRLETGCPTIATRSAATDARDEDVLRFAWPSEFSLDVDVSFEQVEHRSDGSASPPRTSAAHFVWRGARSGARYRVAFGEFAIVRAEPGLQSADPLVQIEYVQRSVEPLLPTIVLNDAAQVMELEGLALLRGKIVAEYQSLPALRQDVKLQRVVDVLTDDGVLTLRALREWDRMVGAWHGASAAIGQMKEVEEPTGGAPVRSRIIRYSVDRRLACEDSVSTDSCVHLIVHESPRVTVSRSTLRSFGFDDPAIPLSASLDLDQTFTIDTHVESLIPREYTKENRKLAAWTSADGKRRVVGTTNRWVYRFKPSK